MNKVNTILLAIIAAVFAGYALYVNIQLKDTVKRYETSATDMADKFEKINEDVLRAREELAKQKILVEEAKSQAEIAKAEAAKIVEEAKQKAEEAVVAAKEAEPVKLTKKEQEALDAKAKAEEAKAKAEALMGTVNNEPNAWEAREAHL